MNIRANIKLIILFFISLQDISFSELKFPYKKNLEIKEKKEPLEDFVSLRVGDYIFLRKNGEKIFEKFLSITISIGGASSIDWNKFQKKQKIEFYKLCFERETSLSQNFLNFLFNLANVSLFLYFIYNFTTKNKKTKVEEENFLQDILRGLKKKIEKLYPFSKLSIISKLKNQLEIGLYGVFNLILTHLFWRNDRYFSFFNFLKNNWSLTTLTLISYQTEYAKHIISPLLNIIIKIKEPKDFLSDEILKNTKEKIEEKEGYGLKKKEIEINSKKILTLMIGQIVVKNLQWIIIYNRNLNKIKKLLISLKKLGVKEVDNRLMFLKEEREKINKVILDFANSF